MLIGFCRYKKIILVIIGYSTSSIHHGYLLDELNLTYLSEFQKEYVPSGPIASR